MSIPELWMDSILSMIGLLAMTATILPLLASAGPAVAVGVASVAATIVGLQVQHMTHFYIKIYRYRKPRIC